jgi:hypothetical protein
MKRTLELSELTDETRREVHSAFARLERATEAKDKEAIAQALAEAVAGRDTLERYHAELEIIVRHTEEELQDVQLELARVGSTLDTDEIRALLHVGPDELTELHEELAANLRQELRRRSQEPTSNLVQ